MLLDEAQAGLTVAWGAAHLTTQRFKREFEESRIRLATAKYTSTTGICQFAVVTGIRSRPAINGQRVQVLRAEGNGRYAVQLHAADGATKVLMLKPENLVLARGSTVLVEGLVGASELNGRTGEIAAYDEGSGRYVVRVEGEARPKRIKAENCRPYLNVSS